MPQDRLRELSHALRNILGPAMMVAERLSDHPDPSVQRGAQIILESLDRATAAIKDASKPPDQG